MGLNRQCGIGLLQLSASHTSAKRCAHISVQAVQHVCCTCKTCEIGGYKDAHGRDVPKYTIPKNAVVIGAIYAIHHNEGRILFCGMPACLGIVQIHAHASMVSSGRLGVIARQVFGLILMCSTQTASWIRIPRYRDSGSVLFACKHNATVCLLQNWNTPNSFDFCPFGFGRRICVGYPLGIEMMQHFTAYLIQNFEFIPVINPQLIYAAHPCRMSPAVDRLVNQWTQ